MATKKTVKKGGKRAAGKPFDFTRSDQNLSEEDRRDRDAQLAEGVGNRVTVPPRSNRARTKR